VGRRVAVRTGCRKGVRGSVYVGCICPSSLAPCDCTSGLSLPWGAGKGVRVHPLGGLCTWRSRCERPTLSNDREGEVSGSSPRSGSGGAQQDLSWLVGRWGRGERSWFHDDPCGQW
jgi:hypothetical protein